MPFDMCDESVADLTKQRAGEFSLLRPAASSAGFVKRRDQEGGGGLNGPDPAGCS